MELKQTANEIKKKKAEKNEHKKWRELVSVSRASALCLLWDSEMFINSKPPLTLLIICFISLNPMCFIYIRLISLTNLLVLLQTFVFLPTINGAF